MSRKFNAGEYLELGTPALAMKRSHDKRISISCGNGVEFQRRGRKIFCFVDGKRASKIPYKQFYALGLEMIRRGLNSPHKKGVLDDEFVQEFADRIKIPKNRLKAASGKGSDLVLHYSDGENLKVQVKSDKRASMCDLGKDGIIKFHIKNIDLISYTLDKNSNKTVSIKECRKQVELGNIEVDVYKFENPEFMQYMDSKIEGFSKAQTTIAARRFMDSEFYKLNTCTKDEIKSILPYCAIPFGFSKRDYLNYKPDSETELWTVCTDASGDGVTINTNNQNMSEKEKINFLNRFWISSQSRVKDLRIDKDDDGYWIRVSAKLRTI